MTKKSTIISIIILAVIILGAWLLFGGLSSKVPNSQPASSINVSTTTPPQSPKPKAVPQTPVDDSKLPPRFPSDIPLEAGATVIQNYTAVNSSGMFQSSREFISAKSMAANFTLYQAALKKNGWKITSAVNDTANNRYIILATQGGNSLNIIISTNAAGQVTVSINNETKP